MAEAFCVFAKGFSCARAHRSTQAGTVNGSRARALAARPPNLRRSLAHLLNVSRWKGRNHAKTSKTVFSVKKENYPRSITLFLQAEGPECPFGLLFAPCR
ncbi:MAG: hypothetical protein II207_00365, partial [Clostridia bacterium]|nr:hypothetical protein [Clostridia bacterium]